MLNASSLIRVAQLSDTHFLEEGAIAEGGFAYDTGQAFEAVRDHLTNYRPHDLIVVTGDIADHGRAEQYQRAANAFAQLDAPVNVCLGNHDQDLAFTMGMGRPGVGTSRVSEVGAWCFLFVDSNSGVMVPNETGRLVDPDDYDDRLHRNGALGERETSWIRDMCATTTAQHVFIWLHHPPASPVGLSQDDEYTAEWRALLGDLTNVRGMAGGHTHVPDAYHFEDVPIFVSPALKNNFDLTAKTMLPPGYRTYEFTPDGSVSSNVHLVDDERWPRHPLGRAVMSLMQGELTWGQFDEIVARKTLTAG